jgi:hypothetical protein
VRNSEEEKKKKKKIWQAAEEYKNRQELRQCIKEKERERDKGKKTKNKSSGTLSSWGVVSGAAGLVLSRGVGTLHYLPCLRNDFQ